MKLYMAVTADKWEFPVKIFDTLKDLADYYGMTVYCMNSYIYRGTVRKAEQVKFLRVEI